jgi:hypothetical protein
MARRGTALHGTRHVARHGTTRHAAQRGTRHNAARGTARHGRPYLHSRQQHLTHTEYPDCWDHNNTVASGVNCTTADGVRACLRAAARHSKRSELKRLS